MRNLTDALLALSGRDVLDLLIVLALIVSAMRLIRGTSAAHAALGAGGLFGLYFAAQALEFRFLSAILGTALPYVVFAAIVVFQTEIRRVLTGFGRILSGRVYRVAKGEPVSEIVAAARALAAQKTGALVVFEREVGLKSFIETGVRLDAAVSYDLVCSIFTPGAPLHDGAAVVQGDRIVAAACFLPLTVNPELSRKWGSRHRAAIGVTEDTDAVVLVVSEETGTISIFVAGQPAPIPPGEDLARVLADVLSRAGGRRPSPAPLPSAAS